MSYGECSAKASPETGKNSVSPKSWAATALLALPCLLGPFGAHRFYAGKTRTAWAMMGIALAAIICAGFGFLVGQMDLEFPQGIPVVYLGAFLANFVFLALFVWATVDLVLILTDNFKDGHGRPIKR